MAFLTMLAAAGRVSSSTHEQALLALLFLYKDVLQSGNTFCALLRQGQAQAPQCQKRIGIYMLKSETRLKPEIAC
jgi:hypothetical protein